MCINLRTKKISNLIAATLAFLLLSSQFAWAYPHNALATTGLAKPETQEELLEQMWKGLEDRHQEEIDKFIQRHSKESKTLQEIEYLRDEFFRVAEASEADGYKAMDALDRLFPVLSEAGGRIQVIFVDNEEGLPRFKGKPVWGHAGTYITVFALRGDEKTALDNKRGYRAT